MIAQLKHMCSDMAASMEAVERYEVEISVYQSDSTSHGMIHCCYILVVVILRLWPTPPKDAAHF